MKVNPAITGIIFGMAASAAAGTVAINALPLRESDDAAKSQHLSECIGADLYSRIIADSENPGMFNLTTVYTQEVSECLIALSDQFIEQQKQGRTAAIIFLSAIAAAGAGYGTLRINQNARVQSGLQPIHDFAIPFID